MPLRFSTPGLYVETFDADPQRIRLRRTDVAGFVGMATRGPLQQPVKIQTWRQFVSTFGDAIPGAYLAYAVRGFFLNGGRTCWVVRAGDDSVATFASVTLDIAGVGRLMLQASSKGTWGSTLRVATEWGRDVIAALVVRDDADRTQRIDLTDPTLPILRPMASPAPALPAAPTRVQTNLLGVSDRALQELDDAALVDAILPDPKASAVPLDATHRSAVLGGGSDGTGTIRLEHLVGSDAVNAGAMGLALLERVDGISLIAIPDVMIGQDASVGGTGGAPFDVGAAHERIIASCRRSNDRVALLDAPLSFAPSDAASYVATLQATSMAAVYYPWLVVEETIPLRGNVRSVPPSGHVAGMIARVDRTRGVHKPPANELLEGVYDATRAIDDATHGALNDAAVNAIRPVPGRGVLVLGTRTLDPDITWRYLNIRRLFLMIEETMDAELQTMVFEPNNPTLWREITRTVDALLGRLWRAGMLDGNSADDAYTVRCDDTTNPPWETDQGRVTCIVGIQPPYPAEFVVVRIGVSRDGVDVRTNEVRDA
jgi:phage tail sheath protein FI